MVSPGRNHRMSKRARHDFIFSVRKSFKRLFKVDGLFVAGVLVWTLVYVFFTQKVFIQDTGAENGVVAGSKHIAGAPSGGWSLLCFVTLSTDEDYDSRAPAIIDTWGGDCDKLLFFGWKEDDEVDIPGHVKVVEYEEQGPERTGHAARRSWMHIYKHYLKDYHFFMKASAESYILIENYRSYSRLMHPSVPLYFGKQLRQADKSRTGSFVAGTSISLSRAGLQRLGRAFVSQEYVVCREDYWAKMAEADDATLGVCLGKEGVYALDTRDDKGRERFMVFDPVFMRESTDKIAGWYSEMSFNTKGGPGCCSEQAISFNFVPQEDLRRDLVFDRGVWVFDGDNEGSEDGAEEEEEDEEGEEEEPENPDSEEEDSQDYD